MISLTINLDSRSGFMDAETIQTKMQQGTRSIDFFTYGVQNKIDFFRRAEFDDLETTVYIDIHEEIPEEVINWLLKNKDIHNVVFHKHEERFLGKYFPKWNDLSYLQTVSLARGNYLVHFDGDMAAYINNPNTLKEWFKMLDDDVYDYISYPSQHSPNPVVDNFDYWWASTRFFMCKREKIDFTEILKCLQDADYMYGKYGEKYRRCPWFEHVLGIIAGNGKVFYPPFKPNEYLIFSWFRYKSGVFNSLNNGSFEDVLNYVKKCGGIKYPCDIGAF